MTNGDRIRQMSNEELAEWLDSLFGFDIPCEICANNKPCKFECLKGIKAYLDMEVEE